MNSLYSGLVDYYPCDQWHTDSDQIDSALGYVNLGMGAGTGVSIASGPSGPALSFDGSVDSWFGGGLADPTLGNGIATGDITFTFNVWVYLDSTAADRAILAKEWTASASKEFRLYYINSASRFRWSVYKAGPVTVSVDANTLGAPATGQWYFIQVYHDADNDEIGIRVNLGAYDTQATAGAMQAGTADFEVSVWDSGSAAMVGRITQIGYWHRLLENQEHAWLYNYGRGRTWPLGYGRYAPLQHNRRLRRRRIA
jgi:hypothetical protein